MLLGAAGGAVAVLAVGAAVLALTGGSSPSGEGAEPAREPVSWAGAATAQAPSTSPDSRDAAGRPTSYAADQMLDADPATAWRTNGDATGEVLTFVLDTTRPVSRLGLVNGYAKTDPATGVDRYAQGRRITRVTWLVDGREVPQELVDGVRELQVVDVGPVVVGQVQLRIDATTGPGDAAFDRTAISEVTIAG